MGGTLFKFPSAPSDALADSLIRSEYEIKPPEGKDDTQFISDILNSYNRYKNDRVYDWAGSDENKFNGNSNNFARGLLEGAGISKQYLNSFSSPKGIDFAPGWSIPLPEMLGRPIQNANNRNKSDHGDKNSSSNSSSNDNKEDNDDE